MFSLLGLLDGVVMIPAGSKIDGRKIWHFELASTPFERRAAADGKLVNGCGRLRAAEMIVKSHLLDLLPDVRF